MEQLYWSGEAAGNINVCFKFASTTFVIFYILLKKPAWFRKTQKKLIKLSDNGNDILYAIISITIFAAVTLILFYFGKEYSTVYDYGWSYYIISWVIIFAIHDSYLYWLHRVMPDTQLDDTLDALNILAS